MKTITIYQENSGVIEIEDRDDSSMEDYSRNISKLLESNNVSILHTSSSSIILRPSKICSIVIESTNSEIEPDIMPSHKEEITEDIITD